jgi:hypothetical protein
MKAEGSLSVILDMPPCTRLTVWLLAKNFADFTGRAKPKPMLIVDNIPQENHYWTISFPPYGPSE